MQVTVETTSTLGRRMKVTIEADKVTQKYNKRIQEIAKSANLDGYRPGKVPASVINMRFGKGVREEVLSELMRTSLHDAIEQEKLKLAGVPEIEPQEYPQNQPLEYVANFEVMPEVELTDIASIEIEKLNTEIQDCDVDEMIEKLRKQHVDWDEVERAAELEDRVIIDFMGKIDGEDFQGNAAEDVPLTLGSKTMIPGFEEGIVGATAKSERSVEVTFPEDYHAKDLANKTAVFHIKIKQVLAAKLPEVDEKFMEKFGIKNGAGIDEFKADIVKNMQRELERGLRQKLKQNIIEKLSAAHEFSIPQAMVEQEIERLRAQAKQEYQMMTGLDNAPELSSDTLREKAESQVKIGLIFSKLVDEFELNADPAKVKDLIEKQAQSYEQPEEVVKWFYSQRDRMAEIEAAAIEEQLVDTILEKAKVTDKSIDYKEFVETTQG